jgi:hypothetical protein
MVLDIIEARGDESVLCTHNSTIEITKDKYLTPHGDCILGIEASKACIDLNTKLKQLILLGKKIKVIIQSENHSDSFIGYGNKDLTLSDKNDLVFRKSNFICNRTALILCSKAAKDLSRQLIGELKTPEKRVSLIFKRYNID